jgi:ubiquinol-cytochrome c reductase cytochrome b/c1 subunit
MTSELEDRSTARNIGLFLVLVVLVNGLIFPGSSSANEVLQTFYLAFFLHAGFTLYDGRFDAVRTVTWVLLITAWVGDELASFFGFIVPWGQLTFWAMHWVAELPLVGETLASAFASNSAWISAISPAPLLFLLCLDIAMMHRETWRRTSFTRIGTFLIAVGLVALVLGFASSVVVERLATGAHRFDAASGLTPPHIMPTWQTLPLYALLRSIPTKLMGVVAVFAAMTIPIIWPWMRVDRLRRGPMHIVWLSLCLMFAGVWIWLSYLGSRTPDSFVIIQSQALAICYFAFFLVAPPVLHKLAVARTETPDQKA